MCCAAQQTVQRAAMCSEPLKSAQPWGGAPGGRQTPSPGVSWAQGSVPPDHAEVRCTPPWASGWLHPEVGEWGLSHSSAVSHWFVLSPGPRVPRHSELKGSLLPETRSRWLLEGQAGRQRREEPAGGLAERRRPPTRFQGHDRGMWSNGKAAGTARAEVLVRQRAWCVWRMVINCVTRAAVCGEQKREDLVVTSVLHGECSCLDFRMWKKWPVRHYWVDGMCDSQEEGTSVGSKVGWGCVGCTGTLKQETYF